MELTPDCLIVDTTGRWIYQTEPDASYASSEFEHLAIQTFRAFVETPEVCSWKPKERVQLDDPRSIGFLRSKAKQTTREVEPGVFEASGKIWPSNAVLAFTAQRLRQIGYVTEIEGEKSLSFEVPFLEDICGPSGCARLNHWGENTPRINLDAYHAEMRLALQIEAGQALENKNYLRNFFEAIVISTRQDAEVAYMGIALCRQRVTASSKGKPTINDDFPAVAKRLYALYRALSPPNLRGFFIISY